MFVKTIILLLVTNGNNYYHKFNKYCYKKIITRIIKSELLQNHVILINY